MATIHDLNVSIAQMPFQEAMAIIKKVRDSRRIAKASVKTSTKRKATTKIRKPKLTLKQILATLPENERKKMIAELEAQLK